ncbi:MAG: hypothetical protein F4085_06560, partial [Acidimicrobiia bacterium]|nr:hypothetical protein [Acidimicrobiia bacterium]
MRSRFIVSMGVVDLLSLAVSVVLASWVLYGTLLPWNADQVGTQALPLLGFLMLAALGSSAILLTMSGPGVPRPSYGRGAAMVTVTLSASALMVLATRVYFSRSLLLVTVAVWTLFVVLHRAVRRRRPWIEPMVVFSSDQEMVSELQRAPHAEV